MSIVHLLTHRVRPCRQTVGCLNLVTYYQKVLLVILSVPMVLGVVLLFYLLPKRFINNPANRKARLGSRRGCLHRVLCLVYQPSGLRDGIAGQLRGEGGARLTDFEEETLERVEVDVNRARFKVRLYKLWWFTLFLAYPHASAYVLRMFVCADLNGVLLLREDFSKHCFDSEWFRWAVVGGLGVLLYPIGVPAVFAYRILKNRHKSAPMHAHIRSTHAHIRSTKARIGVLLFAFLLHA